MGVVFLDADGNHGPGVRLAGNGMDSAGIDPGIGHPVAEPSRKPVDSLEY